MAAVGKQAALATALPQDAAIICNVGMPNAGHIY